MLNGDEPGHLSPSRRSQLRRVLREADADQLAARLRRRADRHLFHVHPALLKELLADDRIRPTGWSAVERLDIDLVSSDDVPPEGYVAGDHLPDLIDGYALADPDPTANLVLHAVVGDLSRYLPTAAIVLDLLETGDARAGDAACRLWRHLLASAREGEIHDAIG
jgi:hypothetical protein